MVPAGPPPTPPVVLVCPPPTPPVLHHLVYCPCWLVLTHTKPRHQAQANLSRQLLESGQNTRGPVDIVHLSCVPSCVLLLVLVLTVHPQLIQAPASSTSLEQNPAAPTAPPHRLLLLVFTHTRVKIKQLTLTPTSSTSLLSTTCIAIFSQKSQYKCPKSAI